MRPLILACLLAFAAPLEAEVLVRSSADAASLRAAPERSFPCEPLSFTDPDAPIANPALDGLVFYDVEGVTGDVRLQRSGSDSIEILGDDSGGVPPTAGPELGDVASWGRFHVQSGTSIGRCLTREPGDAFVLRDCDDSASQQIEHDGATLELRTGDGLCLEGDQAGLRALTCTGLANQRWMLDDEGRLRTNSCLGEWTALTTPNLDEGAAVVTRSISGPAALPDETWALERWNAPVPRALLLGGLASIELEKRYWPMTAIEGEALPLLVAADGRPIAVAGTAGTGRVLGFGTWQGSCGASSDGSYETLLGNALSWLGGTATPTLGFAPDSSGEACFQALGYATRPATPADLTGIDVYVMGHGDAGADPAHVAALEQFLRDGGGLLAARHVFFYWDIPDFPPEDNLTARVFSIAGVGWSGDLADATFADEVLDLTAPTPEPRFQQLASAFEAFDRHELGIETLSPADLAAIEQHSPLTVTARARFSSVSPFTIAQRALKRLSGPLLIGPSQPFTWGDDRLRDMAVRGDYVLSVALPPERRLAHESHELFPGAPSDTAPRVNRSVTLRGDVADERGGDEWMSTDLHAAPGEAITVRVAPALLGKGLHVQIGASFDDPMPLVGWLQPASMGRFPWITAGRLIQATETRFASAFGGPIFIHVPPGSRLGDFDVEIEGAIAAPAFTLDVSDEATWRTTLQDAPLGELASEQVIITARSSSLAALPDPNESIRLLSALVAAEADLVGVDGDAVGTESWPQRLVFDPFEDWGAHSGYPVHATASWEESTLDFSVWPGGSGLWAWTHEFGHDHQRGDWTLDSWGEVTCNVIGVHALETVLGLPQADFWEGNLEPAVMTTRTQDYLDSGLAYDEQGYAVALYFWLYVKESFGWEPLKAMFREYRALTPAERPAGEQEKIDQLCIRMSNAVGRDLSDWFTTFRFPLSPGVAASLAGLPGWDTAPF